MFSGPQCPPPPLLQGEGLKISMLPKKWRLELFEFTRGGRVNLSGEGLGGFTFHQYKALTSFKFSNKDSIRKTFSKFLMHYVNTTFDFWGNFLIEKGKYLVIESSCFCAE